MIAERISISVNLQSAIDCFLQDIKLWIYECLDIYGNADPIDAHDQLTYTTGWLPYLRCNEDEQVVAFLKSARDDVARHFNANGLWKHGYWKRQEAHHGTEHFELFLNFLIDIDPDDEETKRQINDAAEHICNSVPEIPEWYNNETGLFNSYWLGTEVVGKDGDDGVNIPEHLRLVNLCLLADQVTQKPEYFDLAHNYAAKWADAICESESLPYAIAPSGEMFAPLDSVKLPLKHVAKKTDISRAESILASDGISAFLKLWHITSEIKFLCATERLLDVISTKLADPHAGVAAAAIRGYRDVTGKSRYDSLVLNACDISVVEAIEEIGIDAELVRPRPFAGIGRRPDMPEWFENGRQRSLNPILIALAAEISENVDLATRAVDIARTYFSLARQVYPDGRAHGCSSRSVSAIARGHGRDNHAGVTTSVLDPIIQRF